MEILTPFLLLMQLSGALSFVCPQWYYKHEGHCYRTQFTQANWTEARHYCQMDGGDLVSINSQEENDYVIRLFPIGHFNYWIGMVYTNNKFMWLDGTEVNFTDWGGNNPNCMSARSYCKALYSSPLNYQWEDARDIHRPYFICEIDPAVCPPNYELHMGSCYSIEYTLRNYTEARKVCQSQGADLVSVNSQDEDTFLIDKLHHSKYPTGRNYWMGLEFTNKLMWVDGSSLSYSNWGYKEPNCMNASGQCYGLYSNYYNLSSWEDAGPYTSAGCICELDIMATTTKSAITPTTTASVRPNITQQGSSSGQIPGSPVDIKLYTDSAFSQPLQRTVKLGTPVYVQVLSLGHPDVAMVVDSCQADIDTSPAQSQKSYPLIQKHCSTDHDTNIIVVRNQVTRFRFNMFDLPNDHNGIYVTCNVVFCDPMDFSSQCEQTCKTSSNLIG